MIDRLKKFGLYVSLFSLIFNFIAPIKVLAVDIDFFSSNDILFYNPDDVACESTSATFAGGSGTSGDVNYKKRLETTLKFFTGKGLSLAAAAGIAGNLKAESGITPTRIQGTSASVIAPDNYSPKAGVGFGIAQWTTAGRQKNLVKFAKDQGKKITDLELQLEFLWKESTSSYKAMVKRLNSIKSEAPDRGVDPVISSTVLFHGKTRKIMLNAIVKKVDPPAGFEASADSGDKVVNHRGGFATDMYKEYKGKIADGTGVSGVGTESGSSLTGSSSSNCGNGVITGDIVSTALSFALDEPASSGMSSTSDAKPAYIDALNQYNNGANPADCGIYVATVIIASGVDTNYPKSGTGVQLNYVKSKPNKYKIIENPQRSDLEAGDILIVNNGSDHHTEIYTGNSPYPMVDASLNQRVPSVRPESSLIWMLNRSGVIIARVIK